MKFALHFGNLTFPSPKDAKNLALTATTVRFESIIAVEHVVIPSTYETKYSHNETRRLPGDMEMLWPDPLPWLTFIGGATTKLRLIMGVLVLPQRNPLILTKHLETIDYLTEGSFELGVEVGWLREEFDALEVPFERRGAQMDECIKLMRTLWDSNDASFSCECSSFHKMNCNPKPFNGRVPIIAKRAAHLGDGFFPATGTQTEIKPIIQLMHKEAAKIGRNPIEIGITTGCPEALPGSQIAPLLAIKEKISSGVSRVAFPVSAFAENIEEELAVFDEKTIKSFND